MDIPINACIHCTDGDAGKSTCVVMNPVTQDITHIVVYDHQFLGLERLVPINLIAETTPDSITLKCTREELGRQPLFIGVDYDLASELAYWPLVVPDEYLGVEAPLVFAQHEQITPGELAVRRGAAVKATDGLVGHVQGFLADPKTGHITHLVLSRGHPWGRREVTIPVGGIQEIVEGEVRLKLDKKAVGELPEIPIWLIRS